MINKPTTSAKLSGVTDEERMRTLIDNIAGYMELYHGGSVELVSFDGETLKVRLKGACIGCGLSPVTLHGWVEGTVKPFFPKLKTVEAV
jgi:Fe-S cluster biogenesis protein NfuA